MMDNDPDWRKRFPNERLGRALVYAAPMSVLAFLYDWAGFPTRFSRHFNPQELSQIWWHFPILFVVLTAFNWFRFYVPPE
jgi:hypothetical protein